MPTITAVSIPPRAPRPTQALRWQMQRAKANRSIYGSTIVVLPGDNIQAAINKLYANGGGTVKFVGTHLPIDHIYAKPNVVLDGQGGGTIDFGGQALHIIAEGENSYNTGTVMIAHGSATVTGSGTVWTSDMEGQSIMLDDFYYSIESVDSPTQITLASTYFGTNLSGFYYIIADTINNIFIDNLTVVNSSISGIKFSLVNNMVMDTVTVLECDVGLDFDDCSAISLLTVVIDSCTTAGITFTHANYGTLFNSTISNIVGKGIIADYFSNWGFGITSFINTTDDLFYMTNCQRNGFENMTLQASGGIGFHFVSGNANNNLCELLFLNNTGDGIKIAGGTVGTTCVDNTFELNGGYGVNIADAACDRNVFSGNVFNENAQGDYQNLGVGTIFRGNHGARDFCSIHLRNSSAASRAVGECVILKTPTGYPAAANTQAHWVLDDAANGNRLDTSGNSNTLTDAGTSVGQDAVNFQEGTASADFEKGSVGRLIISNAAQTGLNITGALSMGGWIKLESNGFLQTIGGKWEESANRRQYRMYVTAANKLAFDISVDGAAVSTVTGATSLSTGTWYYVSATYSPSTSLIVYIGSALDGINTSLIPSAIFSSSGSFALGADTISAAQNYFDGLMDDFIIWNTLLTGDQLSLAMNAPNAPSANGKEFTTTTSAGSPLFAGIVQEAVAVGDLASLTTEGFITSLKVNGTTDIAIGDFLGTYTVAGIAGKVAVGSSLTAFAIALEGYTANDSNGVIDVLVIPARLV